MRVATAHLDRFLRAAHKQRWVIALLLLLFVLAMCFVWLLGLATTPARYTSDPVSLTPYGVPKVQVRITYPICLDLQTADDLASMVTISARALSETATEPFEIVFPLPDEAIAFVDQHNMHVPGRLRVVPGYPDALPYDLRVHHGNTQLQGGLLRPYRVEVLPMVRVGGQVTPVPELTFGICLESHLQHMMRAFASSFFDIGTPYLLIAALVLLAVLGWQRIRLNQRLRRGKELAIIYSQLCEHIKLERWSEARQRIETIRLLEPGYRDLDQLDTLVSSAETAAWRREQLYRVGVQAYRDSDWPSAVQAFGTIEAETPYYRDVRFLRRTAALYANLQSRDRSLRLTAARELGQIADLVNMRPLLEALGDRSEEVAAAATQSFHEIGLQAFDTLLAGLAHERKPVREHAYQLIEDLGQSARELLVGALRCSDPDVTAQVAMLLIELGARDKLASALLTVGTSHLRGIVHALRKDSAAASIALVNVLLKAPLDRQQVVINALAALKLDVDIDRRIAEAMRATKDATHKDLLERAVRAQAASFHVTGPAPSMAIEPIEGPQGEPDDGQMQSKRRWFWLLDRR